ncbi:hypothetical protein [Sphingomonas sp. KR3-1]|uniref:hypothetical protein n=1 Tax=Sphingomonas sp. KR3-1 TaxID=3156611 RepID=UPI0032B56BE0
MAKTLHVLRLAPLALLASQATAQMVVLNGTSTIGSVEMKRRAACPVRDAHRV